MSATRREAARALRSGDVTLAAELFAVADAVELSELRRAEGLRSPMTAELDEAGWIESLEGVF